MWDMVYPRTKYALVHSLLQEKKQTHQLSLFVGVVFILFERLSLEGHADHFLRQK